MERKKPSKEYIAQRTGRNHTFLASWHHGLVETPVLSELYPVLNIDELATFAGATWIFRDQAGESFKEFVGNCKNPYDLFKSVNAHSVVADREYANPFVWLNSGSNGADADLKANLNPFGRGLEQRVNSIDSDTFQKLQWQLGKETSMYLLESAYYQPHGNDDRKECLTFLPVNPNRSKEADGYAKEIARILGSFSTEYELPGTKEESKETTPVTKAKPEELELLEHKEPIEQLGMFGESAFRTKLRYEACGCGPPPANLD